MDVVAISDEVESAIRNGDPVVALESTIISHGMPYPQNYETALAVEHVVRSNGAIPATIAILDGKLVVGCTKVELERLAKIGRRALKCSRRDLSYAVSQRLPGATTVAGTMVIAERAGIPVFVTGGLGGVHRGAETSLDISADLTELGRTPVAVISAGVKSVLDIPLTLEYLETQGVPVLSLGTDVFPAFFVRDSGCRAQYALDDEKSAASVIFSQFESLKLRTGMVIAVPVPESEEADGKMIQNAVLKALDEMRSNGVTGKDVTPFLLQRINELTEGRSLKTNIALVKNNAAKGARIAVELSKLKKNRT